MGDLGDASPKNPAVAGETPPDLGDPEGDPTGTPSPQETDTSLIDSYFDD